MREWYNTGSNSFDGRKAGFCRIIIRCYSHDFNSISFLFLYYCDKMTLRYNLLQNTMRLRCFLHKQMLVRIFLLIRYGYSYVLLYYVYYSLLVYYGIQFINIFNCFSTYCFSFTFFLSVEVQKYTSSFCQSVLLRVGRTGIYSSDAVCNCI